jgi:hypothetical protein
MDKPNQKETLTYLAWREFPRSIGIIIAGIVLLILSLSPSSTLKLESPLIALFIGLMTWMIFWVIKKVLRFDVIDPYETYLRVCLIYVFSIPVTFLSFWPVRWILFFVLTGTSLSLGAPLLTTILCMGGFWIYDLIITMIFKR